MTDKKVDLASSHLKSRGWQPADENEKTWVHPRLTTNWKSETLAPVWPTTMALKLEDDRDNGDEGALRLLGEAVDGRLGVEGIAVEPEELGK